jgi:hypothetical protein
MLHRFRPAILISTLLCSALPASGLCLLAQYSPLQTSAAGDGAACAEVKMGAGVIAAAIPPAALAAAASNARREQPWRAFPSCNGASLPMIRGDIGSSLKETRSIGRPVDGAAAGSPDHRISLDENQREDTLSCWPSISPSCIAS